MFKIVLSTVTDSDSDELFMIPNRSERRNRVMFFVVETIKDGWSIVSWSGSTCTKR